MARAATKIDRSALADTFHPMDFAGTTPIAAVPKTHNQDPFELLKKELDDLFEEASNFCDGEAIGDEKTAEAITKLHDSIHDCGSRAEKLRVAEKKPLDDQIAAIQTKFHPLIGNTKAGKGKVVLGKEACQTLLTPWRKKVADEKAAEAARIAEEAAKATAAAQAAIQATAGNLAARVEAEEQLAHAASLQKAAKRADKAATTGTGLTTRWVAVLVDEEKAMDWVWGRAKEEMLAVAQRNADELVRSGVRSVPGFRVDETKVAR